MKPTAPPSWLQRDLKVRFIDKDFKGGRYYNSKVVKEIPGASVAIYQLSHLQLYCTAGYSELVLSSPQMFVEDVLTPTSCVCRTEEGRLVDGESLLHFAPSWF